MLIFETFFDQLRIKVMSKTLVELFAGVDSGIMTYGFKEAQGYLPIYDELFTPLQDKSINLFEVGLLAGQSVQLWLDYFSKAKIKVIDVSDLLVSRYRLQHEFSFSHRLSIDLMDSNNLTPEYFADFIPDIAIDDGSHLLVDQLHFVKTVYPILKPGGLLIIEDVNELEKRLPAFEALGWPFKVVDLRPSGFKTYDKVLIIYVK